MIRSEKIDQVCASMFAVQRDAGQPKKNAKANAGKFSYEYLDLPGLIEHLRPSLEKWGLCITQEVRGSMQKAEVLTTVWHSASQQWIEFGPATVPARSEDPQDHGGAITYARRYALAAVFNIAADEDNDASGGPASTTGTGRGGSPSLANTPPPQDSAPVTSGADVAGPEPYGEGGDGPATPEQWQALTAVTDGNENKMRNRINAANRRSYNVESMREATKAEVAAAIIGKVAT